MKVVLTRVVAAARGCSRLPTLHSLSTNTDVDNNPFVHSMSKEQAKRALERSATIRANHFAAKSDFSVSSQGEHQVDADEANRKRIIYRSKQRGWLEVDLLLGRWARQNVLQLSSHELQQYEAILNEETIDIFNYISGKMTVLSLVSIRKASIEEFAQNKKYMSN
ncbi:unnamed protein product [Peronospora destructor]|uniref:Succinate dehydrogenase assembly factor 2, mitochondrial n=1 Tax=Peronospora destructor TaxID=86335 RepID=A0AAV0U7X6_9STRA|nr:unnamed protein product [Peronospora destructor]